MKNIIYCRVSNLKDTSYSFVTQENICTNYCKENNFKIHEVYKEFKSGASGLNKLLIKLINFNKRINLIIYDSTRFTRSKDMGISLIKLCMKKNITIHFVKENIILDNETFGKYEELVNHLLKESENERNTIRNRSIDSINLRKAMGLCLGNSPFGFTNINKKLVKNNDYNVIRFLVYLRNGIQNVNFMREILKKISSESELLDFYDDNNVTKVNILCEPFILNFKEISDIFNDFNICDKYWIPSKIKSLYGKYSESDEELALNTKKAQEIIQKNNFISKKLSKFNFS
jgi:DNA invertase Pin-like site-specific DNA recombinase